MVRSSRGLELTFVVITLVLSASAPALAQQGSVLTTLENQVVTAARGWETTVMNAARSLFWILAGIEIAGWIWLPGNSETAAILLGAVAVAIVGALDDIFDLPALVKLLGQIVAATIPVAAGVRPDVLTLPFIGGFDLGWTAYPLTVIGIVAVVNIVNLMDGIDGLAAGVVAIAASAMAIIALSLDR